ncbi:flagellar biosynthesis regulator FlaF [Parapedomonas caeni]|jgi:flagellar protein FlaF
MSLQAYRRVQQVAESPRQTEYRLFAQVTGALIKARDTQATGAPLVEALDWNRRMWSALSTDCGLPGNQLPQALRAQIISLALWVGRYSSEVARNKSDIDALIDVNKAIMEGLAMQAQLQAEAQAQGAVQASA